MADTDPNKAAADFDPSEAERRANEWRQVKDLADVLMAGFVEDKGHGSVQKYFEPDSQEERAARTAMARVLRSGLPLEQAFLDRLAALFDPREDTHPGIDRRLIFEDRKARRRTDHIRNTEIAIFIADHVRSDYVRSGRRRFGVVKEAHEKACKRFTLGLDRIRQIWRLHRRFVAIDIYYCIRDGGCDVAAAWKNAEQIGLDKKTVENFWRDHLRKLETIRKGRSG